MHLHRLTLDLRRQQVSFELLDGQEEERRPALERPELPLRLHPHGVRVPRVVERPRLPVDVGPGGRAVERRLHGLVGGIRSAMMSRAKRAEVRNRREADIEGCP